MDLVLNPTQNFYTPTIQPPKSSATDHKELDSRALAEAMQAHPAPVGRSSVADALRRRKASSPTRHREAGRPLRTPTRSTREYSRGAQQYSRAIQQSVRNDADADALLGPGSAYSKWEHVGEAWDQLQLAREVPSMPTNNPF